MKGLSCHVMFFQVGFKLNYYGKLLSTLKRCSYLAAEVFLVTSKGYITYAVCKTSNVGT